MAEPDVVLDPDGDLLVILHNPSETFEIYREPPLSEPAGDEEATTVELNSDEQPKPISMHIDWIFKASSKHLSLACPRFKTMMDGPWREATRIYDDGLRHWVLEEFDMYAMILVLSIIHGKNNGVNVHGYQTAIPPTVRLDILVEIARIVDYIECHEVIRVFASNWISCLKDDIPVSYNTKLMAWICIAGVFGNDEIFQRCTRLAILKCHSGIPTLGLPILPEISDEIHRRRERCIDEIFASVDSLVGRLTGETSCSFECDATYLGTIIKHMDTEFPSPRPTSPYWKLSVKRVVNTIRRLPKVKQLHKAMAPKHNCRFDELKFTVDSLEAGIEGLDIESLKKDSAIRRVK
ncbi:hypothetical protein F4782DRAFT_174344 [Xylaria castorea]|nr:hypothetical protein F4782DRAFT_174344 [Xylaria castorea]